MSINEKQSLFSHLRELQAAAGLATRDDDHTIICPLCWQNYALENVSLEHVVPKKVGGRRVTLTCTTCNNNLGADVDAHLSKFQALRDAQQGFGTVRTTMDINGNLMVANLQLKDRNFIVVGKATDPKAIAAIKEDFAAGNVSDVRFTMFYEVSA